MLLLFDDATAQIITPIITININQGAYAIIAPTPMNSPMYNIILPIASKPDASPLQSAINAKMRISITGIIAIHLLFCKFNQITT